jgi:purine nucleoside phosphorylase
MIAILTGSGTYALAGFEGEGPFGVETPFGPAFVSRGTFAGTEVLHLARHRAGHELVSHQVTHQANVWALRELGARGVVAVTVCGSLDPALELGSLVVFDDLHFLGNRLPDGSICTLHTEPGAPGRGHWIFDGPFSPALRAALLDGAREAGLLVQDGGCYGHVDGPRFNTRAELRTLRQAGVTAVSQTAGPEAVLCGEAGLPYGLVGYLTDHANGVAPGPTPVAELERLIGASTAAFASVLAAAVPRAAATDLEPVGTHYRFD